MLPYHGTALVVRTDFSDEGVWAEITADVVAPTEEDFRAIVEFVDDPAHRGLTTEQLLGLVPADGPRFMMVVDEVTVREPGRPILVVDLGREPGRQFRAVPRAIQSIENNLSLANMDFAEFAGAVDADGVFRGF